MVALLDRLDQLEVERLHLHKPLFGCGEVGLELEDRGLPVEWAAHSGSDSDDFTIYLGWTGKKLSVIPTINYERHGLQKPLIQTETGETISSETPYPEVKIEFKLDMRFKYKDYLININMEREFVNNLEFRDNNRAGTVIWIGIEKYLKIF